MIIKEKNILSDESLGGPIIRQDKHIHKEETS